MNNLFNPASEIALEPSVIDTPKHDPLGVTLFLAALVHGVIILTVTFKPILIELRTPPALEVILVEATDTEAPSEADYLAQSSQDGGGDTEEYARPTQPFASSMDFDTDGIATTRIEASAPVPEEAVPDAVLTTVFSEDEVQSEATQEDTVPEIQNPDLFVVEQNQEIARLAAEISAKAEKLAKRPRKTFLDARTQKSVSAEYMAKWVEKVERIGNLNYPDDLRRQQLTGSLLLVVGIYKTGEIESIKVHRSSGHVLLDDAAKRIVRLAAPFAPLTGELADTTDILYIIRTWDFQSGNELTTYQSAVPK